MLIRDVEVGGRRADVRLAGGLVDEVGPDLAGRPELDGRGGALLPGLHDHHVHLLATAAALSSVGFAQLGSAVGPWVRAVGYDEDEPMDRYGLDALRPDVAVRLQHRSGALWVLNSAAVTALGLDGDPTLPPCVERDAAGAVTGRIWRGDDWLGERLRARGAAPVPDLAAVGTRLSSYGITGVSDATPSLPSAAVGLLAAAHLRGELPQHLTLLAADAERVPGMAWNLGPAKIVVADHALPALDDLLGGIAAARAAGRAVAVHCVTHAALLLVLAALEQAGAVPGDRIEHAAVTPPDALRRLAALGVRVVTQPSLPARHGDHYLDGVDDDDRPYLWPYRSLLDAGVPVACSSDAPYGDLDPWVAVRAAAMRRTAGGRSIGAGERVSESIALAGYLGSWDDPGGPPRRVEVGAAADLVLLEAPLAEVLAEPDAGRVRATVVAGRCVYPA